MPLPSLKKKKRYPNTSPIQRRKSGKLKAFLGWSFKIGLVLFLLGVLAFIALIAWYSRGLPDPNKIMERNVAQSTKIYDSEGKTILYEIHGEEKRTLVKLEDIPDSVKWATIAAEDENFYYHHGIDIKAIVRTAITNILRNERAGGSTITQQFVKNAILTSEKRYSRKLKELILSWQMENKFSKDEILQMYLNEIPYGSTSYGIQSAAQTFLGKDAKDLSLAESALLAAIPNAPSYFSPYGNNVDKLYERKDWILGRMADLNYITQDEAEAAQAEEFKFKLKRESITAPHFVMYVRQELSDMFGEKFVEQGGLKVYTTLDLDKQKIAEEAVLNGVEARSAQFGFNNAALIALDPTTGKILAMVGSKDYFDNTIDGNVNITTRLRQPGSSLKPMVYAALFKKGYTPATILFDVNTVFKTESQNYEPQNYDGGEHGPVTIRTALQGSLNIPAVKAMYLVGVDHALDFFEMLGYSSFEERSRFGLALALGGGEVQLLEHAAAYSVFPSEGIYHEPAAILRVEDSEGNILFEYKDKSRRALDSNIAKMINNVLSDNNARAYVFGTNSPLALPGRPVAAKTGTTNDNRDAWTMGYTPSLVAGVWAGNNDNSKMYNNAGGGSVAAPIWNEFMRRALEGSEVEQFENYTKPNTNKAILNGDFAIEKKVEIDTYSGKLATELTPESSREEKTFKQVHSILYYLDKDDPLGPAPSNPAADPQFSNWESAVITWANKKKNSDNPEDAAKYEFINKAAPSEYDDVHTIENKPTIFLQSPQPNEKITTPILTASVTVSAPRGVSKVEYFIDGQLIKTIFSSPFSLSYPISSTFVNGYHSLRVVAHDDVENTNEVTVDFNLMAERVPPSISWVFPLDGTVYQESSFPVFTAVNLTDVLSIKKVNFFYRAVGTGDFILYGSDIAPSKSSTSVLWGSGKLSPGQYELRAQAELKEGLPVNTNTIIVTVK